MKLCGFDIGLEKPFFLIAGPCVIESRQMAFDTAGQLLEITSALGNPFIYKSSFDKANRSSGTSYRGPGMDEGLQILAEVRSALKVPVLTDVHDKDQVSAVAAVVDVLQTPAFLCRQTDFIEACAASGKPVNIKKGQFLAPHDMVQVVNKARHAARAAGVSKTSWCASVGFRSATTILCLTCVRLPLCVRRNAQWCLMLPIQFSCQAGRELHRVVKESSSLCWHAPRSRQV